MGWTWQNANCITEHGLILVAMLIPLCANCCLLLIFSLLFPSQANYCFLFRLVSLAMYLACTFQPHFLVLAHSDSPVFHMPLQLPLCQSLISQHPTLEQRV